MTKKITIVTPKGIAVYPHLVFPDTKGEYADNKYKVQLQLDPTDLAKVKADIKRISAGFTYKVSTPHMPFKMSKDGVELLVAKSRFLPAIIDAQRNIIVDKWNPPGEDVLRRIKCGPGSVIKIGCTPFAYDKGLSLQLEIVQIIQQAGGSANLDGFDEEDGYVFAQAEADGFGDDETSTEGAVEEDIDL